MTVWNEFRDEQRGPSILEMYPDGVHGEIGCMLADCEDMEVRLAAFYDEEHGLSREILDNTDVLPYYSYRLERFHDA